jgi:protein CpxP
MTEQQTPQTDSPRPARTRRRKLYVIAGVTTALGLAVAIPAMAGNNWRRGPVTEAEAKEKGYQVVDRVLDKLDGTAEQQKSMDALVDLFVPKAMQHRAEGKKLRQQVVDILTAETVDRQALEQVRKEVVNLVDRASVDVADTLADAAEVLTPEQRAEVADFIARRMARHGR